MARQTPNPVVRWYGSFYFRIGFSFVAFVVILLVAQSAVFNSVLARPPLGDRAPGSRAAMIAGDLGSALSQDPSLDLDAYLKREYARLQPIYVVLNSGDVAANRTEPMPRGLHRMVEGMLAGEPRRDGEGRRGEGRRAEGRGMPPLVTAPLRVHDEVRGMVVLPPGPPPTAIERQFRWLLSVPGTSVLILLTVAAAVFIFEPARRRLKALQRAAAALGRGDLAARADVAGSDEVAALAGAFNSMADDLAARDAALRASDRLRRQMLADVSHELKTPLTAMRGYVETLRRPDIPLDPATRDRYLETIERETVRLDRMVKDLLDLARLESGAGALDVRVFDSRRLFDHVLARHHDEISRRQMQVHLDVAEDADQIVADPDRIEQVVENLFANALRHTPDGGSVECRVGRERADWVITIADSGKGIPAEHLPFVFERFYKVDVARASGSEGSGLGLSIAKAIVERHRGTIDVESAPGRTVFTIRLPHDPQPASANL